MKNLHYVQKKFRTFWVKGILGLLCILLVAFYILNSFSSNSVTKNLSNDELVWLIICSDRKTWKEIFESDRAT